MSISHHLKAFRKRKSYLELKIKNTKDKQIGYELREIKGIEWILGLFDPKEVKETDDIIKQYRFYKLHNQNDKAIAQADRILDELIKRRAQVRFLADQIKLTKSN